MEFSQWTESYSVGDPLMDAYHHIFFQTILDLGNNLHTLSPGLLEERIAFLVNYAGTHFDSEEHLMEGCGFPDIEAHRQAHQRFKERLLALQDQYQADHSPALAEELLAMTHDWLKQHILGEDMKYKPFLRRLRPCPPRSGPAS
jgi:hemerythrin